MNYVMHFCRNSKCNNGWIDRDLTYAKSKPPQWKYCKECSEKLGIEYDEQTPDSNLSNDELERKNERRKLFQERKNKILNLSRKNMGDKVG